MIRSGKAEGGRRQVQLPGLIGAEADASCHTSLSLLSVLA